MSKRKKELLQAQIDAEKKELNELKKIYAEALSDIDDNIAKLLGRMDADAQHVVYRVDYQRALKGQINGILDELNSKQFESISEYISERYTDGFVGSFYNMAGEGIPIITPIDPKEVVAAMRTDSKISKSLYSKLGEDTDLLKKRISGSLSRGIAAGQSYEEIARNIAADNNVGFNKAMRIARTEGARVYNTASYNAAVEAKKKGADVLLQWDATLDGRTRPSHRRCDGEIREIGEKFSNGLKFPCDPAGDAEDVINCRCVVFQTARWALDEDELETLKQRAAAHGLDKTAEFEDFKKKYLKAADEVAAKETDTLILKRPEFTPAKTIEEAQAFAKQFCKGGFMAKTFKGAVDYKGISVDNANAINKALLNAYGTIQLEKISGIKVVSPTSAVGKKAFKSGSDAVFSYSPIEHGIFINKDILKNSIVFEEYVQKSDDAWKVVMQNIDKLSGEQKKLVLTYQQAGRSLVDGETIEGMLIHEMGHHVQWTLLNAEVNNAVGANMSKYAPKISGYANASKSEYLAESYVAYMKGETDILDPVFVKYLDNLAVKSTKNLENTAKSSIINQKTISSQYKITEPLNEYDYYSEEQEVFRLEAIKELSGYDDDKAQETLEALCGTRNEYLKNSTAGKLGTDTGWFAGGDRAIRTLSTPEAERKANIIHEYIMASPKYDGTIYRGAIMSKDEINALVVDGIYEDNGALASWSTENEVARMFAEARSEQFEKMPVVLEMNGTTRGTPTAHLSIYGSDESEVLISNMTSDKYDVLEITEKDGITFIKLKERDT